MQSFVTMTSIMQKLLPFNCYKINKLSHNKVTSEPNSMKLIINMYRYYLSSHIDFYQTDFHSTLVTALESVFN